MFAVIILQKQITQKIKIGTFLILSIWDNLQLVHNINV